MTTLRIDPRTGTIRMATNKEIDKEIMRYNEEAEKKLSNERK